jgi:molybdate transport system substrate-binding protein
VRFCSRWIVAIVVSVAALASVAPAGETITISAAVSLKEALSATATTWRQQTGDTAQFNFGATGHLLAQIREGAPVDVFVAASDQQMDQAEAQNLVDPSTRTVIAGNEMVLIVPAVSTAKIASFADLAGASLKRLAIGQPKTVPAGMYATQTLHCLGMVPVLADRIVYGSSVRQVLDYVARGEVVAGIVYATDAARAGETVRVVATAQAQWHLPIHYVAAVVASSKTPQPAKRFVDFLRSEVAQKILRDAAFVPPVPATQPAATTRTALRLKIDG